MADRNMSDRFYADYYVYMFRLWRGESDPFWRASLEDPHTGELRNFASPQRAFAFIEAQINQPPGGIKPGASFPNTEDSK